MGRGNKFANITIVLGIVVFLFIFLFSFSRSRMYPELNMTFYFYGSLLGAAVLTFVLLKFGTEAKIRVALVIISTGLCIIAAEILLEKYYSSMESKPGWFLRIEAAKKAGYPFDSRTRYQVLMDLRKKDKDFTLPISPSSLVRPDGFFDKEARVYPLGSASDRPMVMCNESGEWLTYRSDEHGFRNPKGVYDKDIDVVLVGDSFAQGQCVDEGQDIAGLLRKETGLNVLNLGLGSNGPLIELAGMKEYAEPFKPKVVLMFYYPGNDMESIAKEKTSPVLIKYLEKDFTQSLLEKQEIIDKALDKYIENVVMAFERDLAHPPRKSEHQMSWANIFQFHNLRYRIGLRSECHIHVDPIFKDIVIRANNMVNEWGGKFIFVYLTAMDTHLAKKNGNPCRIRYYKSQRQILLPLLKKLGISYIDIEDELSDYPDMDSLFPPFYHGHYNAKGYRVVTEKVIKYLKEHKLLSYHED